MPDDVGVIRAPVASHPVAPRTSAPSFSVVIPAFRAEATLAEAVSSALAQEPPALEVIVADDGSDDDTAAVAEGFGSSVRVLRLPHGGCPAAKSAGARAAAAEFTVFLDADDVFLPGKLRALGELGRVRPDLDLLCTDTYFAADGRVLGRFGEQNHFAVEDQHVAIIRRCFVGWPAVRTERLRSIGYFDDRYRISHDWHSWLRLILGGSAAGMVDQPLGEYRLHPGSLTADRLGSLSERLDMLRSVHREALRSGVDAAFAQAIGELEVRVLEARIQGASDRTIVRRTARELAACRAAPSGLRLRAALAAVAPRLSRDAFGGRWKGPLGAFGGDVADEERDRG